MGGAGKQLPGHGAHRKSHSPSAWIGGGRHGRPPHPQRLHRGARFWPKAARRPVVFAVSAIAKDGTVRGRRLDGTRRSVQATRERLLARTAEGDGSYYEFLGYLPGRAYRTWARVERLEGGRAMLVAPEWHPGVPVPLAAALLPAGVGEGDWVELGCDLGAVASGHLQPRDLRVCEPPPAEECPAVAWTPPTARPAPARPPFGRDCGDLVADLPGGLGATLVRGGHRELSVGERPALEPGARIYLSTSRGVAAYLKLAQLVALPSMTRLVCEADPVALATVVGGAPAPVSERCHWRWWPRTAEGSQRELERYAYDVDEHAIGYVWRHRPPATGSPGPRR